MRFTCPECGNGQMESTVIASYATSVKGSPCVIPDANVLQCSECGKISVATKEVRRWEQLCEAGLAAGGVIPSPAEVKLLRESLQVSVSEFAALLGVTRQTVHGWERGSQGVKKFGPAAILLQLLVAELAKKADGVWMEINLLAQSRGIDTPAMPDLHTEESPKEKQSPLRKRNTGGPSFSICDAA